MARKRKAQSPPRAEPSTRSGPEISGGTGTGTVTVSEQRRTATYDSYVNILLLDGEEAITLKVQNQDRGDTYVRTGRNVPMSFLMRAYADGPAASGGRVRDRRQQKGWWWVDGGGDCGVLRWVPRRVVDGVADSVWVLTVKGGLLGSVDVIRSSCLIGSLWVLRLTGRWAWKGRMARLSTDDVDWICDHPYTIYYEYFQSPNASYWDWKYLTVPLVFLSCTNPMNLSDLFVETAPCISSHSSSDSSVSTVYSYFMLGRLDEYGWPDIMSPADLELSCTITLMVMVSPSCSHRQVQPVL
ncbi:hypothetical protein M0R45_015833 [Rubus argutus]|uniref:Uncharacterized protein n=1 Tax=Rubus argutus TaxID=59490 RepID=A0AAW1XQR1_RUBAR